MKEIVNHKEATKVSGVSPRTIKLVAKKIGEGKTYSYIISRQAVTEYIQKRGRR